MTDGGRISLCIIARDEEDNLRRCLASAAEAVDEIVVVDTGSQDGTVGVAESFGARVTQTPWPNDFAAARNRSIAQATGDWILWLDADDELSAEARAAIRPLVRVAPPQANGYQFCIASWVGEKPGGGLMRIAQTRLWRNRTQHRFHGAIHEWLQVDSVIVTDLVVYHYGYLSDPVLQRRKSARNIALLRDQLQRNPEDARHVGYLAVELAAAGHLPQSLPHFRRSWELAKIHFVGERYARTLIALRRFRAARRVIEEALERFPDYTDLHYHRSCVLRELGEYGAARAAARRCIEIGPAPGGYVSLDGYASFLAHLQVAHIETDLHNWGAAIEACVRALTARADLTLALPLLVGALMAHVGAASALQVLSERDDLGPATCRLLAREFAGRQAWVQALELLRRVGTAGELPGDRLLRAECLLALSDEQAAACELEALRSSEFVLNRSRRATSLVLRCLTAWMRGDMAAAAADLDSARRRGPGVVAGLMAFHRRLLGVPSPVPEGPAARSALLALAEKTLLVRRPDLTAGVAALLGQGGDPVVDSGVLGRLFLRHGYPEPARGHLQVAAAGWGRRRTPLPVCGGDRCDVWLDLGEVCLMTGEWTAAVDAFRQAVDLGPHRLRAHLGLAEAHLHRAGALLAAERRADCEGLAVATRRERLAGR